MFQDWISKFFCFAVCLVLLGPGCDTIEAQTVTGEPGGADATLASVRSGGGNPNKTVLKALAVPEGICLVFDNIPQDTTWIVVHFSDVIDKGSGAARHGIIGTYTDIRGNSLEHLKQTGRVICPFVQTGYTYNIGVYFQKGDRHEGSEWLYTVCVAGRGIGLNNDINLSLNATQTGVTLSSEPEFSAEVQYAPHKFSYSATIKKAEDWSVGIGDNKSAKGLTWDFEPELSNEFREEYLESGSYPAYVTAFCNLIYGDLLWSVEIAKSREFILSLQ